ncbi:hypothetical protein L9F63_002041, partial [Diploptera punctata]
VSILPTRGPWFDNLCINRCTIPTTPSSDACSWRSSTPSPPLSEGGSTSTFWSQVTTDEGIVIDDYDELPRKKKFIQERKSQEGMRLSRTPLRNNRHVITSQWSTECVAGFVKARADSIQKPRNIITRDFSTLDVLARSRLSPLSSEFDSTSVIQ